MQSITRRVFTPLRGSVFPSACVCRDTRAAFYREELLKHQRCLDQQREYFSEQAIRQVECALQKLLNQLDTLCRHHDCDRVMSGFLKKFDIVTRLSAFDENVRLQ